MSSSFASRKQIKLFFRSLSGLNLDPDEQPSSVSFSITQNYAKEGEVVTTVKNGKIVLKSKEPYIRIHISSANSLEVANDFLRIFAKLLSRYKSDKDEIEKLYKYFIPEFLDYENYKDFVSCSRKAGKESIDTKISKLKQVAPDLFISDYARKCLCQFQPIPISDEEVESWKENTFTHKGETLERQVLAFPPDNPKWNFVCPDDKYPFPGVKRNKLENKNVYAGLPCCYVNDQIGSTKSKYYKIYKEGNIEESVKTPIKPKVEIKESELHMIKSDKIVSSGRYGSVPNSISELLKNDLSINEIRRKGVPRSINSLLHCVSIAIKDKSYIDSKNKEKYITDLRNIIAEQTFPSLCKQEMYDFTNEEILLSLKDNSFLDPNFYYRAIEESYKINLFVFAPSSDEEKRLRNKEESSGVIELPRFKVFPSRSPRPDRPTILIYRTMGSESDILSYPQCELIVSFNEENEKSVFNRNIYDLVFEALLSVNRTITWELVTENNEDIDILARDNLYSRINFFTLTNSIATEQYIDEYGKLRGLYLPIDLEEMNEKMLMVIPSSSPENINNSR